MKNLACLLFFLMLGCQDSQTDYKVILSKEKEASFSGITYTCSEANEEFSSGKSEIKFIEKSLEIKNSYNTGDENTAITFLLDKELKIVKADYHFSDDTEDGSKDFFHVKEATLRLNKNPFAEGIKNLEGDFVLKVKVTRKPAEFYRFSTMYEETVIGRFECQ